MMNDKNYLKKSIVKRLRSLKMKLFEFELQGINQAYFLSLLVLCMSGSLPCAAIGRCGGPTNQSGGSTWWQWQRVRVCTIPSTELWQDKAIRAISGSHLGFCFVKT